MDPQPSDLAAPEEAKAKHGRPRSTSADDAILTAAIDLLGEVGYRALCMETVAARAGVSKATLYRRHHDKEALITATVLGGSSVPPKDLVLPAGSTRELLTFLARTAAVAISSPSWLSIVGAVFSEAPHEGGLPSVMRSEIFDPSGVLVRQVVKIGLERGELRGDLTADVVNDVVFGALLARAILGEEITDEWIDRLMKAVWLGFKADSNPCDDAAVIEPARAPTPNC